MLKLTILTKQPELFSELIEGFTQMGFQANTSSNHLRVLDELDRDGVDIVIISTICFNYDKCRELKSLIKQSPFKMPLLVASGQNWSGIGPHGGEEFVKIPCSAETFLNILKEKHLLRDFQHALAK